MPGYIVTLKYASWHQSWPDVFGLFDNYDSAKRFADKNLVHDRVLGFVIDHVREPEEEDSR